MFLMDCGHLRVALQPPHRGRPLAEYVHALFVHDARPLHGGLRPADVLPLYETWLPVRDALLHLGDDGH